MLEQATQIPSSSENQSIQSALSSLALQRVLNVDLELRIELGRVQVPIREILDITSGKIVHLAKTVNEPVEIFANDKLLAKGEIITVNDDLGIRITEILNINDNDQEAR